MAATLGFGYPNTYTATNTSATLTRPNDATGYAAGDLVANSTTAGSIVLPTVTLSRMAGGSGLLRSALLITDHTTGLDAINFTVDLWTTAPTFSNGDNGAYAIATNGDKWLGSLSGSFRQFVTHAVAMLAPDGGVGELAFRLASGTAPWSIRTNGAFTPAALKNFYLIANVQQD